KVGHVRHSARTVVTQGTEFILILMRADDHDVWANVELFTSSFARLVRYPGANVHVGDADPVNVRLSPSQAVLYPLHEHWVEAARLVVRISGNAGQAGPFVGPLAQNPIFATWRCRPIQKSSVIGDERRSGPQGIRDLLGIRRGMGLPRRLSDHRRRS